MKLIKNLIAVTTLALATGFAGTALAHTTAANKVGASASIPTAAADMADGEIRKIDKATKKLTIKHGEIKNLDMPGMTMLFQVKDPAMLDAVKVGDRVKFRAENSGGAIVVTDIQVAK